MKNAVVTGGHGFIGTHLIERLKHDGYSVHMLPRESFADPEKLSDFLKNAQPDIIFHLAAYGNYFDQTDIDQTVAVNIFQTYLLMRLTQQLFPECLFVNFSSSSVQLERHSFYSISKMATECLGRGFTDVFGMKVLSVRPASIYGPNMSKKHFIPQIIKYIQSGESMNVVLEPTHTWTYIDDFIDGLMVAVAHADQIVGYVNISSGKAYANAEVIEMIEMIMGKSLKKQEMKQMRDYDTVKWNVENDVLKRLGFTPRFALYDGLRETVAASEKDNT